MPDSSISDAKANPSDRLETGSKPQPVEGLQVSHIISFCAVAMLVSFFLPWLNLYLVKPSGFHFANEGGSAALLYGIPILCTITFFAGITKQGEKALAYLTGALPFWVLVYGLNANGQSLLSHLEVGAYASLLFGALLLIIPSCRK